MSDTTKVFFEIEHKSDKQHILDAPDTYIGSIECVDTNVWIMNSEGTKIVEQNINYIPGLFKLFDEGIVNCRDHVVRMAQKINEKTENALPVTHIDITIDQDGTIHMLNDGNGMDIIQDANGIWQPELAFAHLRTSGNYKKNEERITGGKNGYGFKLVLLWSTYGRIETVDHIRGLKYIQEYKNNLDEICKPSITKCKNKPYTKISFKPDYARLGISGLTPDIISLFQRRVYDIGAATDKSVKVKYNNALIPVNNFEQYISLYIGNDKISSPRVYECGNERWEYAVAPSPNNEFIQISFVNGIHTSKGGKHVDYILNQILKKCSECIEQKKKIKVSTTSIKEQLILFLRCDINNPTFDSQSKDYLNTPFTKFGSKCDISDKFIEKILKMGIMQTALQLTDIKDKRDAKKNDGVKRQTIVGLPKLTDAERAGTAESYKCILILCEGDSAKSGIISGLTTEDRKNIGVYPLKGKILNVRGETIKKINDNEVINDIKKCLGLESGTKYNTIEDVRQRLRYGKVVFMTDQDLDGSHIKGLGVNLFDCEWETLLKIPGFLGTINTPILKAKKANNEVVFYNEGEYNNWKLSNSTNGWNIKYYKGLGTSTANEFKQYFKNKKIVDFVYDNETTKNTIDMVFNKKRSDDRKNWLKQYKRDKYLNTSKLSVKYDEFINEDFIHFSKYDCDRSIPNLMDGLKISLRKILYSGFKRKLTSEIKVAQFAGYVSEHSEYHHGEDSLNKAIIGMAQNFMGSNNINLLIPSGQFGTRLLGGKDAASPRYIFTQLNNITRHIFIEEDDLILNYLNDDGKLVEPLYYAPIIPMILVNGSKGIGTGSSTDIMCYNPNQIINYLKNKLLNIEDDIDFIPYYDGFTGTIRRISPTQFLIKGSYQKINENTIKVTELPVGYWTSDFKDDVEQIILNGKNKDKFSSPIITDMKERNTDTIIDTTIVFVDGKLTELESTVDNNGCNGVEKLLKLYTTNSITNMNLFDENDVLQKYDTIPSIIDAYYNVRLKLYQLRKDAILAGLNKKFIIINNKVKYIKEVIAETIDLRHKTHPQIVEMLKAKAYDALDEDNNVVSGENITYSKYYYLVHLPMDSVSETKVINLNNELKELIEQINQITNMSIVQMWLRDLNNLENVYSTFIKEKAQLIEEQLQLNKEQSEQKNETNKTTNPIKNKKTKK